MRGLRGWRRQCCLSSPTPGGDYREQNGWVGVLLFAGGNTFFLFWQVTRLEAWSGY